MQAGISNLYFPSVVIVCLKNRNSQTGDLEAITISKHKVTIEIPQKIYMCIPDSNHQDSCTHMSSSYSTSVRSAILIWSKIEYDRGGHMQSLDTCPYWSIYIEKRPCHHYGDQSRLICRVQERGCAKDF